MYVDAFTVSRGKYVDSRPSDDMDESTTYPHTWGSEGSHFPASDTSCIE